MSEQRLRIAIQKSGRLSDGSFELLKSQLDVIISS